MEQPDLYLSQVDYIINEYNNINDYQHVNNNYDYKSKYNI